MPTSYFAYFARCADDTLYAGYCSDPVTRAAAHNAGSGAKYTRSRLPVQIIYTEKFTSKSEAMQREYQLKQLTRSAKLALINS